MRIPREKLLGLARALGVMTLALAVGALSYGAYIEVAKLNQVRASARAQGSSESALRAELTAANAMISSDQSQITSLESAVKQLRASSAGNALGGLDLAQAVGQLQNDVAALQGEVNGAPTQADVINLSDEVATLSSDVQALCGAVQSQSVYTSMSVCTGVP